MNDFEAGFETADLEMERFAGEPWTHEGQVWMAVSVDTLDTSSNPMPGGKFRDGSVSIVVRNAVFLESKIKYGDVVTVREERMRVDHIGNEGAGTRTLICGPAGVKTPKF